MHLRKLKIKDSIFMLEWMKDIDVVKYFDKDFLSFTLLDCKDFIRKSLVISKNLNLAIVSKSDEYMGTVSLKNIDTVSKKKVAEFSVVVRKKAMNKGYSWFAMSEIINIGFNKIGLDLIYWYVSKDNLRAIKFYEKHNFIEDNKISKMFQNNIKNLKWYSIKNNEI